MENESKDRVIIFEFREAEQEDKINKVLEFVYEVSGGNPALAIGILQTAHQTLMKNFSGEVIDVKNPSKATH